VQVLTWSGNSALDFVGGPSGLTLYAIFDSTTDTVGPLQSVNIKHDMFCPGIATLPNGNVIIVAGHSADGAGATSFWTGSSFTPGPGVNFQRGYNTAVMTTNGEVRIFPHVSRETDKEW
jgi:galactose oxidase